MAAGTGRARRPDHSGTAVRDGVRLAWDVYGEGPTTVLLLPTWSLVDSRHWKMQAPTLARHHRVITFDGRGSGRSDRPVGAAAYTDEEYAADAVAVLDATGTDAAVVAGFSCGVAWAVHLAANTPERVRGVFAIAPSCGLSVPQPDRERHPWSERLSETDGWAKYNRYYWTDGDFDDFRAFFFDAMCSQPHSTKQVEDCLEWSAEVDPRTLVDTTAGRMGLEGAVCQPLEPLCAQVRCPVEIVHGADDRVRTSAVALRLAELTGAGVTLLEGSGHALHTRDPVRVTRMLDAFVRRVAPPSRTVAVGPPGVTAELARRARAARGTRRVLYLSSPIGLGHACRDLAIVAELRERHPDLRVDWLAQAPVAHVLEAAGERVHPASRWLASEVAHVEEQAGEHDLHAFQAIRRMDEIMVTNYLVLDELVTEEPYDLVVGDEAWEVDHFLHENPERKRFAFAWMTDFVGWLPMPQGGDAEVRLTADYNEEMLEQRARFAGVRDRSIFVGDPEDVVEDPFGPGLPRIRDWTEENFDFAGYVTGFTPSSEGARQALRSSLGFGPDDLVCVATVGGSGVGGPLLHRVMDAVPLARRLLPELHFLVVCGPRVDPASIPRRRGARVRGYLPRLHEHLAASDVAVVQGGLTTCMELTASRTPFVYVPLENHFEQNRHVRHRLDRYEAGRHLAYAEACDPEILAAAVVAAVSEGADPRPVDTGGAARAAGLLAPLL